VTWLKTGQNREFCGEITAVGYQEVGRAGGFASLGVRAIMPLARPRSEVGGKCLREFARDPGGPSGERRGRPRPRIVTD
jgi:hypothetical protein